MAVPELIPIAHEPDYHTDLIGRYDGGQFFGCVTAALDLDAVDPSDDWMARKRWYAVLHLFDAEGVHVRSEVEFAGTTADGQREVVDRAEARLAGWLAQLAGVVRGDIAVRLFEVTVDGIVFGLVDQSAEYSEPGGDPEDKDYGHVELLPNTLGFNPPWDGLYDT